MSENKKDTKFKLSPWAIYGLIIGGLILINLFGNDFNFKIYKYNK